MISKKNKILIALFLVLYFLILAMSFLMKYNIKNLDLLDFNSHEGNIVSLNNITQNDNVYQITGNDSNFVIDTSYAYVLKLNMKLTQNYNARIYYSDQYMNFSEENAIDYNIKNGENIINIDYKDITYIRIDLTEECNYEIDNFEITEITNYSRFRYTLENIPYVYSFFLTLLIILLINEIIKLSKINIDKTFLIIVRNCSNDFI